MYLDYDRRGPAAMFCFSIYRFSSIVSYTDISSLYKNRMHYCPNQSTTVMYRVTECTTKDIMESSVNYVCRYVFRR